MKQILLMIAVVALVGCGKKTTPSEPETNAEPKVAAEKQEPPKVEPQKQVPPKVEANKPEPPKTVPKPEAKIPTNAFVNTLGMPFVPVPGTEVRLAYGKRGLRITRSTRRRTPGWMRAGRSPRF